jgi:hypothetical protein
MRLWYARRGIPWVPFLACLALASAAAGAGQLWPQVAATLLPAALAACAAAPGFLFDDPSAAAVAVTPRGGRWARLSRCCVAAAPAGLWLALLAALPRSVQLDRSDWAAAGLAGQLLGLGLGWLASRRGVLTPGSSVAGAVAGITLMPFVIGPLIGWTPL